jgi:hypothetical protein
MAESLLEEPSTRQYWRLKRILRFWDGKCLLLWRSNAGRFVSSGLALLKYGRWHGVDPQNWVFVLLIPCLGRDGKPEMIPTYIQSST